MMTHIVIRGLILYQIWMMFSINKIIINKNPSTKIREPIVHIMSRILLSHWYMKVHITRMARIIEIIKGINLESFQKITKNLHII